MFSDQLQELFNKYGWVSKKIDESWVISTFETEKSVYAIYAGLSSNWLTLTINTNISLILQKDIQATQFRILRLNYEEELFKFCINEKNNLIIRIDHYYQKELDYSLFEYALDSVAGRIDDCLNKILATSIKQ